VTKPSLESERLAVLVHEVRSPVAALSAIAEALVEGDTSAETRRELVRLVTLACRGVERVVGDAAVASIRTEPIDPERLVRDVVAAAVVRGAPVELVVVGELPVIDADASRLRQALDNLIANASAHGPAGGPVVVRAEAREGVLISVSDEGPGIAPDQLDRIFEVGVRLDPAARGSGLGLPLARAIVEGHGGTLTAQSMPGEGATFVVALPLGARRA
jgi:signal transduction histidine kinase